MTTSPALHTHPDRPVGPALRLILVFSAFTAVVAILLASNTTLTALPLLTISVAVASILTVGERWGYRDLFRHLR